MPHSWVSFGNGFFQRFCSTAVITGRDSFGKLKQYRVKFLTAGLYVSLQQKAFDSVWVV